MVILYVVLGLLAFWYFLFSQKRTKGKPIPGPGGPPIIGQGLAIKPETLHLTLSQYADEYGDIVQLKAFQDRLISLNTADLIRKAFNNDPYKKSMNDRPLTFWGKNILYNSESIGFYPKAFNKMHGDLRKGFTKAIHVYGDGNEDFENSITHELRRLHRALDAMNGKDFNFVAVMKRSLSNVVAYLLSGEELQDDDDDVNLFWQLDYTNEFMLNSTTNILLLTFPFLVKIPGYYKRMYNDSVDARDRVIRKYFIKIRETHKPGVIRGIVDFLLDEQKREKVAGGEIVFTDERIINTIIETIAAGILTSLSLISNTILCLIHHPEYQDKVQKELNDVIGRGKTPSLADRSGCPLLEAIITESSRYIPITPLGLVHLCSTDMDFEGHHVPAGSLIIPNVWHVHHDEAVWGDPWTFRPERWLDDDGQLFPSTHPLRKHWFTFGNGRRQCVGEQFARNRLFLYLAHLLKEYRFTATPGKCGPCDPRKGTFDVSLIMRTKPFHCKVERRS